MVPGLHHRDVRDHADAAGRMANAVRDNPERAKFIGYNPTRVRWLMMTLAGFFAGVSGGLAAINYEIVTAETLGVMASGNAVLMAFIGGIGHFWGRSSARCW